MKMKTINIQIAICFRLSLLLSLAGCGSRSDVSDKATAPYTSQRSDSVSAAVSNTFNLDDLRVRITDHIRNYGQYELSSVSTQMGVVATARGHEHGGTMQWILVPCEKKGQKSIRVNSLRRPLRSHLPSGREPSRKIDIFVRAPRRISDGERQTLGGTVHISTSQSRSRSGR